MVCAKTDTPRSRWTHHDDLDERADACYEDTMLWSRVIYTLDLNGGSLLRASTTISFTNAIALHSALMPDVPERYA